MSIEDTSKRNPITHLSGLVIEGSEGYITGMEKAGGDQLREQANSAHEWVKLPREMQSPRADFEALGFEFHPDDVEILERVEAIDVWGGDTDSYHKRTAAQDRIILAGLADPLFVRAKLPEGWKVEDGKHHYGYWNYVVDADGYRRVSIFYKAAFYDRGAHMGIDRLPQTGAQADAWEKIEPGHEGWRSGESYRDDANYVYVWRGRYGDNAPEGKHAYSDDGRRLEIVVAPDGTVLERREFTTEPGGDDDL